jgi:hypothetical protein
MPGFNEPIARALQWRRLANNTKACLAILALPLLFYVLILAIPAPHLIRQTAIAIRYSF